jgi:apolipoprotein N-acyltransferase
VCLAPLLAALRGRRTLVRLGLGWLTGAVAGAALVLGPTGEALARYFEIPPALGWLGAFALSQLYGALPFVLFAFLCGDPARGRALLVCARVGAALIVSEAFRSVFLGGLPWGLFALSLAPVPWLAQTAAWGGAALVGGLLAAANAGWLRSRLAVVGIAALLAAPTLQGDVAPDGPGAVSVVRDDAPRAPGALRVRLVQGALPASFRRDPRRVPDALARLAAAGAGGAADLVVWSESALAAPLPANLAALRGRFDGGDFLLLGAPRTVQRDGRTALYNAAVLVDADARWIAAHDKTRLVPFAETPRETPGDAPRALPVRTHRIGAMICYELIFADVARSLVRDGAGLLVNLSNDEWFGTSRGSEQHFATAVIRAIETRRPLLRATNTGITAALDASGRVIARLPAGEPAALVVDVHPAHGIPLAVRLADSWTWLSLAITLLFLGSDARGDGERGTGPQPARLR